VWQSVRQAANGLDGFCESRSADPQSLALAVAIGALIAANLQHADVPDQALRLVRCCLRTSERLVREYPDDPIYRVRLSEGWCRAGKANWSARRHDQAEAALRAAAQRVPGTPCLIIVVSYVWSPQNQPVVAHSGEWEIGQPAVAQLSGTARRRPRTRQRRAWGRAGAEPPSPWRWQPSASPRARATSYSNP